MFTNLIAVIILQYIHTPNHHVVHLKCIQCHMSNASTKQEKNKKVDDLIKTWAKDFKRQRMKRSSTPYVVGELTIQTTVAKVRNTDHTQGWRGCEQQEFPFVAGGNAKRYSHSGGIWAVPYKVQHSLTTTALSRICPVELKTYVHTQICHQCLHC